MTSHQLASPKGTRLNEQEFKFPQGFTAKSPLNPQLLSKSEKEAESTNSETISVILKQLLILFRTSSLQNWKSHHQQIRYILESEQRFHIVHSSFLYQTLKSVSWDADKSVPFTGPDLILKAELAHLTEDCELVYFFVFAFRSILLEGEKDLFDFLERFSVDPVLSFIFVSTLVHPDDLRAQQLIKSSAASVLKLVAERSSPTDNSWYHLLLHCILASPTFPFLHKILTIGLLNAFNLDIPPVQEFFSTILTMSFKEIITEVGPEKLLPEKLLPSLLLIKPEETDQGIALILAEVLIPGSQGLSTTNGGVTALTFVNNLPEANAKGAQLQTCLKTIDTSPAHTVNWFNVFAKVHEFLFDASKRNSQPSVASLTQFLSSLDFKSGLIDIFLSYEWWFDKTLLYMLQSMHTQQGAFDIIHLKNLTLCYEEEIDDAPELLSFINIAKLEVQVMAKINSQTAQQIKMQSEGDKKLDTWLSQFFDLHCRSEPHHVIAGALAIADKDGYILDRIDRLFAFMMDRPFVDANITQLGKVLNKFKMYDIQLAIAKLIEYYTNRLNSESLNKVIQASTSFDLFDALLKKANSMTYSLYLTFAIEASNFGFDYKKAIENDLKITKLRPTVYQCLLEILETRTAQDFELTQQQAQSLDAQVHTNSKPLKVSVVYTLLELIKGSQGLVDSERLKNLQLSLLTTYPRLINFGTGHDEAILKNEELYSNAFPPQVEQEMKAYYSKMYNKDMEIKEIVDMLSRMKTSDLPHDQDVFACMIHSLIDEYRFFSEYPLTALASTSLLFGALLQRDLIQGTTLTVALNFIWESCNQPQDSHLFKFAVQSLYNFKSRLHEYPIYCKHLLKCQSLSSHAKMYQIVKDASNGIPCPDTNPQQAAGGHDNAAGPSSPGITYNSISATKKTVGIVQQEVPDESTSDKLLFSVNNMTSDNMKDKLAEIQHLLSENYFSWFANYLVTERAKTEPNNHGLYSDFLFAFDDAIFYEYVLNTTLSEVDHLLRNFKDSTIDRSNLKNLGAWLGKITLANDKPLKRDQIALKYLLVESFDLKTLPIVIPFVCKILDQASESKVFRPPNPWILGIMKVLVELYDCADLKLNLKFEIEVLFNSFGMKIKDVEASTLVRSHNPKPEALAALFGIRPDSASLQAEMAKMSLGGPEQSLQMQQHLQQQAVLMQQQQQQQQMPHVSQVQQMRQEEPMNQPIGSNQLDASFSNLQGNSIFTQNPNLRRAFQASLARAVRECAVPILSRVSEAVLTTTEALVQKDFATEGDVNKFRKSYQTLAQQLAHSMVVCSGRKILSETIEATMIQLLGNQINPNDLPLAELNVAIQANIDLCVDIVEKLAVSNICELIEERMRPQVIARERHSGPKPYIDESVSDYSLHLPPPLGLPTDGLRDGQLNIYTGFGTNSYIIRTDQAQQSNVPGPSQTPQFAGPQISQPQDAAPRAPANVVPPAAQLTPQQAVSALQQDELVSVDQLFGIITLICEKAIQLLSGTRETSLSELSADHPILQTLTQALSLSQSNALKHPELLLKVAQYAVNCLFTQANDNPMSNEIYVVILDKLCEYSPSTAKDVTWWMVHSVDQRKFNMPVIFSLLKVQLVAPLKLDSSIGRLIEESSSPMLVKFASSLLLNVFSSEGARPIALRSEFAYTLEALSKYTPGDTDEHKQAAAARDELFAMLNSSNLPALPTSEKRATEGYTQMGYIFTEWVKLIAHGDASVVLQKAFIDRLFHCGILTDPSKFELFFKAATEISTTAFATEHEIRSRTQREVFLTTDSFASLIVAIILRFKKDHALEAIEYLKNILDIIVVVMVNEHETSKATWNERAYFKIFSSILCMWTEASILDAKATVHIDYLFYPVLGEIFNTIQPIIYPGFTFAWISLIAHRMFLPKLLGLPEKAGYGVTVKLLTALLKFQNVYLKDDSAQHDVMNVIFKAINRIFTALAHDAPQFLIDCHYQLVTAVPSSYIQLRNIVLSAIPKDSKFMSPLAVKLSVDELPDCESVPDVFYQPIEDLAKVGLKKPVENFLRIPAPALMRSIYSGMKLNHPKDSADFGFDVVHFNVKLINALVVHVGISAAEDNMLSSNRHFNGKSSQASLLADLMGYGDMEFKYHLAGAIANQLRYPNMHTQWFVSLALYLFSDETLYATSEVHQQVQEIITRVLIERHLVNKPHPWGLSLLLTELVSNPAHRFFSLPFVKNASPEMKVVFDALPRGT